MLLCSDPSFFLPRFATDVTYQWQTGGKKSMVRHSNNFLIFKLIYFLSLLHYFRVLHTEQRDSVSCYVVVSVTKTTIADEPEVGGLRQA